MCKNAWQKSKNFLNYLRRANLWNYFFKVSINVYSLSFMNLFVFYDTCIGTHRIKHCFKLRSLCYEQFSSDDMLSQGHLMVVTAKGDRCKDSFNYTSFEINRFPKEEPITPL